ncbi:MAG: PAS domain S-box protein [Desulfobacterales bacterium]|nr:MAG: PAS domain S-box protein [Desulfobacterales bacterium]
MKDTNKTKKQLIEELSALRRQVTRLERSETSPKQKAHYRTMVEASPVSIMAMRKGRVLFSNPAGARMLGFSHPNEMVGIPAMDVVAPESQQLVTERIKRLESGKDNPSEEMRLIRQDGIKITVEAASVPIDIDGIPTAVIIAHDVSDRKELETKLKESQERFRAFMDNIPASVYIKDENDIHIYANQAASKSVKKKLEELIGSTTRDLWPPDLADRLIELDRKVIDEDVPKITEEWKITEKGDVRWQKDIKFPIVLESGNKLLGGVSLDIT